MSKFEGEFKCSLPNCPAKQDNPFLHEKIGNSRSPWLPKPVQLVTDN